MSREKYEKLLLEEESKAIKIKKADLKQKMDILELFHEEYYDDVSPIEDYPYREFNTDRGGFVSYKRVYEDLTEDEVNKLFNLVQANKYQSTLITSSRDKTSISGTTIIGYLIYILGFVSIIFEPDAAPFAIIGALLVGTLYLALGRLIMDVSELLRHQASNKS